VIAAAARLWPPGGHQVARGDTWPDERHRRVQAQSPLPGRRQEPCRERVVLKPGRTLTVCRSDVLSVSDDGSRRLCATSLAT